ncbi:nucleoplasmin-like protein ANO39 isoform X4 [Phyllopteryx taeniolatus]|uniref:nucleoplasmin-like protein ANO39 isoform X4 n=1 Tax=Phyllopteryx taeniolatus TaxID=161469 RepID=UPI002AD28943|nr:nucleoplasmin-like protein ANO39 isoform X4 [Phyllopteryx taeniolatus]
MAEQRASASGSRGVFRVKMREKGVKEEEDEDEEQICRREENERHRQLPDAVCELHPRIVLHTADVREEDLRPEKREYPDIKKEEEPQTPHMKDEEQEDEISKFPLTGVTLKDEDDDGDRWGGSQSEDLSAPLSDSDDVTSHSSDYEDEDDERSKALTAAHAMLQRTALQHPGQSHPPPGPCHREAF